MRCPPAPIKPLSAFRVTEANGSTYIQHTQNPDSFQAAAQATGRQVRPATAEEIAFDPASVRLTARIRIGSKPVTR